jgi:hypothetical protein
VKPETYQLSDSPRAELVMRNGEPHHVCYYGEAFPGDAGTVRMRQEIRRRAGYAVTLSRWERRAWWWECRVASAITARDVRP